MEAQLPLFENLPRVFVMAYRRIVDGAVQYVRSHYRRWPQR